MINKVEAKNLDNITLENLVADVFDHLSKVMSYKEMMPLLLVSKKLNEIIKKCPSGQLAEKLLPQSQALARSTTQEFLFNKVLTTKNIKPFCVCLACLIMLGMGKEELFPLYVIAFGTALVASTWNIKQESHNFGLFKNSRSQQIKEIEKPLYSPVNSEFTK